MNTYVVNLKMIGEARLIDVNRETVDVMDVGSISKNFGNFAETICNSHDLIRLGSCKPRMIDIDKSMPEFMIDMLHFAHDMDQGKFRGQALADAVTDGILCGGIFRGDVALENLRQLDAIGLATILPFIASSRPSEKMTAHFGRRKRHRHRCPSR